MAGHHCRPTARCPGSSLQAPGQSSRSSCAAPSRQRQTCRACWRPPVCQGRTKERVAASLRSMRLWTAFCRQEAIQEDGSIDNGFLSPGKPAMQCITKLLHFYVWLEEARSSRLLETLKAQGVASAACQRQRQRHVRSARQHPAPRARGLAVHLLAGHQHGHQPVWPSPAAQNTCH